ncbi:winged helix-turn-helix domain-containing protein [Halobaculum gomorrense]|uniref:winged helix-turn-helix domain-containing protein n=1 Tax=Halobaculum gomorrense TaxID=43928 RepID=UPI00093299FD|nr:winged helix-turn-helix domain-containing protein [Halobaculum gomorrense]
MDPDEHPSRRTFELLANEIRLRIITALGDASGEDGYASLAFSDLREATGVEDSGKFTYHLKQLIGEFVEETEPGYSLTLSGIRAYQAVVGHQAEGDVVIEPFDIPGECPTCGGQRRAWYENGRGHVGCGDCGETEFRYPVDARHVDPEDVESLLDAMHAQCLRDYGSMIWGICPYCGGTAATELRFEADHWEETGMIDDDALVHGACESCSWFFYANLAAVLRLEEPVQAFFAARGVDIWSEYLWTDHIDWIVDAVDVDPVRVRGHFAHDGDHLSVVVDGDVRLIEARTIESV